MQPKDVLVHLESGKHRIKEVLEYKNPIDYSQLFRIGSPLTMNDLMKSQLQLAAGNIYQYQGLQNTTMANQQSFQGLGQMLGGPRQW